jgi:hypothetical protein
MKASVGLLRQKLHWRIAFAAIAVGALLAWFGISQIGMMGHGFRPINDHGSPLSTNYGTDSFR